MTTTITEALAELKTIGKRLETKTKFVLTYLGRVEGIKDPLERDGGMISRVAAERQAIKDLQERTIAIRRAIQKANVETVIVVEGASRSIADWLVWRREVAPAQKLFLEAMRNGINQARTQAKKQDGKVVGPGGETDNLHDVIISVSETELSQQIEHMETVLGGLDGQLSLKNATVTIDV